MIIFCICVFLLFYLVRNWSVGVNDENFGNDKRDESCWWEVFCMFVSILFIYSYIIFLI